MTRLRSLLLASLLLAACSDDDSSDDAADGEDCSGANVTPACQDGSDGGGDDGGDDAPVDNPFAEGCPDEAKEYDVWRGPRAGVETLECVVDCESEPGCIDACPQIALFDRCLQANVGFCANARGCRDEWEVVGCCAAPCLEFETMTEQQSCIEERGCSEYFVQHRDCVYASEGDAPSRAQLCAQTAAVDCIDPDADGGEADGAEGDGAADGGEGDGTADGAGDGGDGAGDGADPPNPPADGAGDGAEPPGDGADPDPPPVPLSLPDWSALRALNWLN